MTTTRSSSPSTGVSQGWRRAAAVLVASLVGIGGLGGAGSATAQPVAAPAATSIAIRALQSTVQVGASGTIVGNMVVRGLSAEGRSVDLEARPLGTDVFTPVGTTTATAKGMLRLSVQPAVTTRYRWRYAGDADARARVSGIVTVRVRATPNSSHRRVTTLGARTVRGVVKPGGKDVVSGQLRSAKAVLRGRQVVLLARSADQRSWHFRTSHRTGRHGQVRFTVRPKIRTDYRLAFAGTTTYRPSTSAIVSVDMRPVLYMAVTSAQIDPGTSSDVLGNLLQGGSPVAGATVELLAQSLDPGAGWAVEAKSLTKADGAVDFTVRPDVTTRYRLRVRPASGLPRAVSVVIPIVVREPSTLTISGTDVAGGFSVSGQLTGPNQPVAGASVTLEALDSGTQIWTAVDSARTGTSGRVSFQRPSAPGTGYRLTYAGNRVASAISATVTD